MHPETNNNAKYQWQAYILFILSKFKLHDSTVFSESDASNSDHIDEKHH